MAHNGYGERPFIQIEREPGSCDELGGSAPQAFLQSLQPVQLCEGDDDVGERPSANFQQHAIYPQKRG